MSSTPVSLEEEYMKNPDLKKEDIETLKQWAQSQQNIPEIKEIQLILFHHSCYYNLEDTKSCIQIYYSLRMSTPDLFDNRCLSQPELKKATEVLRYGAFPIKDPNGYQIMFHGLQDYDPSRYVLADALKVLFMGVEACTYVEGTVPGYIFLFDMTGVRLGHITRLSLTLLKKVLTYIQDAIPVRLKAIHIINTLPLIDKVMFLMKPFMKKELLKMIHFHSSNNEEIQKYLPKPCIPVDFGGDLPSCSEMQGM
ncbi:hypothetical protein AAG570_011766 [Ranatra chinensis]|uniref:CRAL-TRIO domain-containing protein n=1 Tax=Ranatra chinensis TaxID=642074 RepID=A0ABD0YGV5_9HEMI